MFYADAYTTMPVKRKKRPEKPNSVQDKFASAGQGDRRKLEEEDIKVLTEESNSMVLDKIGFLSSLFHTRYVCRNDRKLRLKNKAIERFDRMLDINSLVLTRVDTTTLINLLLDKTQRTLFKHQHDRAVTQYFGNNLTAEKKLDEIDWDSQAE